MQGQQGQQRQQGQVENGSDYLYLLVHELVHLLAVAHNKSNDSEGFPVALESTTCSDLMHQLKILQNYEYNLKRKQFILVQLRSSTECSRGARPF
jgi:hypothetical protein